MDIPGKRVLVTGGALRIGAAIARAFAKAGAKVVIQYRESAMEAEALVKELGGASAGHSCVHFEFGAEEPLANLLAKAGAIDVLVNNASSFVQRKLQEENLADAKSQFEVNFWAPSKLMKLFAAQPGDNELAVVNILDQRISKTDANGFSYALSKKALAEATLAAAAQLAPRARVNGVAPGPVFPPKGMEASKMEKTLPTLPLKRPVAPEDLAAACVFLASNSSITGSILHVDCGQHLV